MMSPGGPLSNDTLNAFLDLLEPVLAPVVATDPFSPGDADGFDELKAFVSARIANVQAQIAANNTPSPR